ncbi:hypothetical protein [Paraburkholderia fungorum]|nr:hypothetical protein [Paraburkholderia fungorum]
MKKVPLAAPFLWAQDSDVARLAVKTSLALPESAIEKIVRRPSAMPV